MTDDEIRREIKTGDAATGWSVVFVVVALGIIVIHMAYSTDKRLIALEKSLPSTAKATP